MKNILIIFCATMIFQYQSFAHSGKPKYHVVIDTDGAIDDFRAISMLLAENDVRVLAVTCSQGTLEPVSCFNKVNSLLSAYYHNGISVGISEKTNFPLPLWNNFAEQIKWGVDENFKIADSSIHLLNKTIKDYPYKITLIALGSFKTYADLLKKYPENAEKIERIIWYNKIPLETGFNFLADTASANFILKSNVSVQIVSNTRNDLICNEYYLSYLKKNNSIYARQIIKVHQQSSVLEKVKQNHLQFWDDIVPLFLSVPILFNSESKNNISYVTIDKSIPTEFIYEIVSKILQSGTLANNRVFTTFPTDSLLYKKEYALILGKTLEKYGEIEWKAITMTNEIHGHTGIYSIIGAKMGIRVCEYFNVGVNNLKVTTFAGSNPPLSCLNDGIQISTGSTIGQGLIQISDSIIQIPTAIFEFNNQKVKISLKSNIAKQIQEDINQGVKNYGLSDAYWIYIENLAIKYWVNFDRHEIFDLIME